MKSKRFLREYGRMPCKGFGCCAQTRETDESAKRRIVEYKQKSGKKFSGFLSGRRDADQGKTLYTAKKL